MFNGNEVCVYDSVALIRKFLDYKTIYPHNLPVQIPCSIKFICENYHKWFPEHESFFYALSPVLQKEIDEFEIKPLISKTSNDFDVTVNSIVEGIWKINGLWMFDYILKDNDCSHSVVGFPTFDRDMYPQYAILVLRDYQPILL